MAIEPPATEWWALAAKTILLVPGIGCNWNVQWGLGVALPQRATGLVPSGRVAHRFWCVTASRSM